MIKKISVLIVDEVPRTIETMKNFFSHESKIKVLGECNNGDSAVKMVDKLKPDIVILDINMKNSEGISPTEIITAKYPNTLVIVTFNEGEKKSIKKAMSEGAREYIVKPFTTDVLIDTVLNLFEKDNTRRLMLERMSKDGKVESKPKIISVFSTKGGVGKTTISTNLAVAIAEKTREKVALIDLDLQFGDVAIMMNLYPERTILEVISDPQNIDIDTLDEYLLEHPSGIKVLPAPTSPEYSEYITSLYIQKIIKLLHEEYKYIVVDMAPSFEETNLTALDMSDNILFVTTLDLTTIKNVKVGLRIMDTLKYDDNKISLVLNRYHRKFGISPEELEKATDKKILQIIPEDSSTVIKSTNSGKPFVVDNSRSSISKSIMAISDYIISGEGQKRGLAKIFKA